MCKVTNEMVIRANEKFVKRMEENRRRNYKVASDDIVVPVNLFGLSVNHRITVRRVNEIYGEALKKAKAAYGEKI